MMQKVCRLIFQVLVILCLASQVTVAAGHPATEESSQIGQEGSVSGYILNQDGQPITDTIISVHAASFDPAGSSLGTGVSQVDGSYTISGLIPGSYRIIANNNRDNFYVTKYYTNTFDWDAADPVTVTAGQTTSGINFNLAPGGKISGIVTRQDGTPVQGACINLTTSIDTWNQVAGWGDTAADGSFTFGGIPAGPVYIRTYANCRGLQPGLIDEWYAPGASSSDPNLAGVVVIIAGQTSTGINFQLDQGGSISGFILNEQGQPITDTQISVHAGSFNNNDSSRGTWVSQSDGSYTITGLLPGSYRVEANNNRDNFYVTKYYTNTYNWSAADPVTVNAGQTTAGINFNLELGGKISGIVTRQDGTPVEGACVNVFSNTQNWNQVGGWGRTGPDGTFNFGGLLPGTVYIRTHANCGEMAPDVTDEWYAPGASTPDGNQAGAVAIVAGQTVSGINFQLDPTGIISGRVTDSDGNPVPNIVVSLDGPGFGDGKCTNANGEYTFNAAFDVAWRVRAVPAGNNWCGGSNAYAQQFWPDQLDYEQAGSITLTSTNPTRNDINFVLHPGGGITGHVYQADGTTPISGVCVYAFPSLANQNESVD